jgi:hypothetical protein
VSFNKPTTELLSQTVQQREFLGDSELPPNDSSTLGSIFPTFRNNAAAATSWEEISKGKKRNMCINVTVSRVRVTIVAVQKAIVLNILCVCL